MKRTEHCFRKRKRMERRQEMKKILVAYFSASGVTASVAERIRDVVKGDIYEIKPAVGYTKADLDWRDADSRSSVEMKDTSSRPELKDKDAGVEDYDTIYIGFPIWWYREPSIIDSFLESYDFSGKTIVPFATSGSSGMGDTAERIRTLVPGANVEDGARLDRDIDEEGIRKAFC